MLELPWPTRTNGGYIPTHTVEPVGMTCTKIDGRERGVLRRDAGWETRDVAEREVDGNTYTHCGCDHTMIYSHRLASVK